MKLIKWNMKKMYNYCKNNNLDLPKEGQIYKNNHTKYIYICSIHNKEYKQLWGSHKDGYNGCPLCFSNKLTNNNPNKRWNMKKIYNYCKEHNLDLPKEGQKYINLDTKYIFVCLKHGEYKQTWHNHKHSTGCKKCSYLKVANKLKKTPKEYKDYCDKNTNYIPIDTYIDSSTKIKHKCNRCGNVWEIKPNDIYTGYGCPVCSESHGEKYIRNYLNKHNIKYESQKRFHDLKDKTYLSYDFYLPDYNILIEYQGIQHYESVSFNGKDYTDLEKQQEHDKLKREYAKNNGYKLLELHYSLDTQDKVNTYLSRRIKG